MFEMLILVAVLLAFLAAALLAFVGMHLALIGTSRLIGRAWA